MKLLRLGICFFLLVGVLACGVGCGTNTSQRNGTVTYTATLGKIKVTLTIPAKTNSVTKAMQDVYSWVDFRTDKLGGVRTYASFVIDNGSSSPTLGVGYLFTIYFTDGTTPGVIAQAQLEKELKLVSDLKVMSEGELALSQLLESVVVNPGTSSTNYCYFIMDGYTTSNIKRVTVTSGKPRYGETAMKKK